MARRRSTALNRLTPRFIATLTKPGRHHDGGGLYLEVDHRGNNAKSWAFHYMIAGKARSMGLGPVHAFSLAEARARARQCRQLIADGLDPLEERRKGHLQRALTAAKTVTLAEAAEAYIASQEPRWKRAKQAAQWRAYFRLHVTPRIGHLPVAAIDTNLVTETLGAIWREKPVLAQKVRQALEAVLDAARVKGQRAGENPARWRGHLDKIFVAPTKIRAVKHHAAVAVDDLPALMTAVRARGTVPAQALQFLTVTAVRREQVLGMRWSEVNLAARIWISPPENVKTEKGDTRPHRIPLSEAAIAILKAQPIGAGPVFPQGRNAMGKLLRQLHPAATCHGMRSAFKDFARQHPEFADELSELALHHRVGGAARRAYARDDMIEERRPLMRAWAAHCTGTPVPKVAPLVKPRRPKSSTAAPNAR